MWVINAVLVSSVSGVINDSFSFYSIEDVFFAVIDVGSNFRNDLSVRH